MRTHISVLGWCTIALHGIYVIIAIGMLLLGTAGSAAAATSGQGGAGLAGIIASFTMVIVVVLLVIGLPGTIIGFGLLRCHQWARIGAIVISILNLLAFPVGTALGIYGLWILFNPETQAIFEGRSLAP